MPSRGIDFSGRRWLGSSKRRVRHVWTSAAGGGSSRGGKAGTIKRALMGVGLDDRGHRAVRRKGHRG